MRTVEASAKTREEAIQSALGELGVEMYQVDHIEILDEGSGGFLGFGSRPARVRLTVENLPDVPSRPQKTQEPERRTEERQERSSRGGRNNRGRRGGRSEEGDRGTRAEEGDRGGRTEGRRKDNGRGSRGEENESRGPRETRPSRRKEESAGGEKRGGRPKARPERTRNEGRKEAQKEARPPKQEAPVPDEAASGLEEDEAAIVITDEQGKEAAALLQEIIAKMGIEAKSVFQRGEDGLARINVESEDGAILIGRKGRNLSAMQYLVNRMVSQGDRAENTERLVVDVEGYVDRRRTSLEDMALSLAARAKETSRNMRLKPLSPQERRIIHLTLQDDPDVRTYSLGDSLYRSVIISPKDARPERPRGRSGRNGGGRGGNSGGRGRSQGRRERDDDFDAGCFGD